MSKEYTRALSILGFLPIAGQIVLSDDFEGLLNWTKVSGIGDAIFELDPTLSKHGNQSLYMKTRTEGADTGDIIGATRYFHLLPSKVMSFLCSFHSPGLELINTISFLLSWTDYTLTHTTTLRFSPNIPKWEYYGDDDQFHEITEFAIKLWNDSWHFFNLTTNFATNYILSTQIDHLTSGRSPLKIPAIGNGVDSYAKAIIQFNTIGPNPAELRLDDILIHEI